MVRLKEVLGILAVMLMVSVVFGCTDNSTANATTATAPTTQDHNSTIIAKEVLCANPECVNHQRPLFSADDIKPMGTIEYNGYSEEAIFYCGRCCTIFKVTFPKNLWDI